MPTDSISSPVEIARAHRESAVALWATVPPEGVNMEFWQDLQGKCGTTRCALGWLAYKKHDGWTNHDHIPELKFGTGDVFSDAATYFGITYSEATRLFGPYSIYWGRMDLSEVTLAMVSEKLMSLPYSVTEKIDAT